ncbi:MAG: 30S ribosomal protein S11 [Pseudomonadota bacterium]
MKKNQSKAKKRKVHIPVGTASVQATFNNTIITICDQQGNTVAWSSAGMKFKGPKKSTPFAAQEIADMVSKKAQEYGMKTLIEVKIKGPGGGREAGVRALANNFTIVAIRDNTAVAHNGCRPRKRRRV